MNVLTFQKTGRRLVCSCLIIIAMPVIITAQLNNNAANIVFTPGVNLVLDNIDLVNNGGFNQTTGTVTFSGNINSNISGSSIPAFYNLILNKSGANLQLQSGITVNNQIMFTGGLLDLNLNNILLATAALLNGENESSHIIGNAGGYVEITKVLNAPLAVNPGNIGVEIISPQNLGLVTIRRGHQSQANSWGNGKSILRYYDINAANNIGLNATLRIHYLDAELNGLNESLLTSWKSINATGWSNLGRLSSDSTVNFIMQSGINDFTRFTLSVPGNPLPLKWKSFNTQCLNSTVRISWETEQEQNTSIFTIRRSADGRNWTTIGVLPAAGNSRSPAPYSFIDAQPLPGTGYYQVLEQDYDGRQIVSPVLFNDCGATEGLRLFPNPAQDNCHVIIRSSSGGAIILRLYDSKGVLVQQRNEKIWNGSNQFELDISHFATGMYSLVITWPDGKIKVARVEKH